VKRLSGKTRQGNRWLRQVLVELAHVAAKTKLGEPMGYGDSAGALKAAILSPNCHNYWLPGVPSCAAETGRGQGNVPLC